MIVHCYLTHPQVRMDPDVPVPQWGLSDIGAARIEALAARAWPGGFVRIVASGETKAVEAAAILGAALGIVPESIEAMHENDRSATGFLPPPEFEAVADRFFAQPRESIRGWEKAADAQTRIVTAVRAALAARPDAPTLFIGHGGVGTLLKCHVGGRAIARSEDQGPGGGGRYFHFTLEPPRLLHDWRAIEAPPPAPLNPSAGR